MIRELEYDDVFDSQKHYRLLLDSMARPGKLNVLRQNNLHPPVGLLRGAAIVGLALFNSDVTLYVPSDKAAIGEYFQVNTGSRLAVSHEADFLLLEGDDSPELLETAKEGILTYPEQGATLIIQVEGIFSGEHKESLALNLSGPGVNGSSMLYVKGVGEHLIRSLKAKNTEFPLGVDTILVADEDSHRSVVACLPRSTKISTV